VNPPETPSQSPTPEPQTRVETEGTAMQLIPNEEPQEEQNAKPIHHFFTASPKKRKRSTEPTIEEPAKTSAFVTAKEQYVRILG